MALPEAVSVALSPKQIAGVVVVTETTGSGFTLIVTLAEAVALPEVITTS